MKKETKVIWGIAAFMVLLLAATLVYNSLAGKVQTQVSSSALSAGQATSSPAAKTAAPDITVQDANGKSVSLSSFKGKPVVLNFWASWCPPCKAEMPDYEKIYKQYSAKGVVFMMVNLTDGDRETLDTAKQFLKSSGYTFPAYFDVGLSASDIYGVSTIPKSVFIDKDGNFVNTYNQMITAATMQGNIENLLK